MPSAPAVTMPTVPTVTIPTVPTITLSTDYNSSSTTGSLDTSSSSTSVNGLTDNSNTVTTTSTDSTLTSLATSALQQLVGTADVANSTNSYSTTDLQNLLTSELSNSSNTVLQNSLDTQSAVDPTNSKYGKILRCNINGANKINSFKNYWISKPEKDGAFLFTGTYYKNNTTSNIFYMYFFPESSKNYTVSISTEKNTDTFLSKLVSKTKSNALTAERTGNLIALRQTSSDLNFDLLLSIDFAIQQ